MKPFPWIPQFLAPPAACIAPLILLIAVPATAASLELSPDSPTGRPGKFAAEEIRREALAHGMALGEDANATRIALTVATAGNAAGQSYSIRVKNEGGRRSITVRGADALAHWKRYAAIRDAHYVPALYNRVGRVDVTALTDQVAADLDIARNWKTGTLKDDGRRSGTEKGFRK
jgi:hypothetical protein